jgi:hypothetical protein
MTSQVSAATAGHPVERQTDRAQLYQEGLVAGAIGATVIAAWFLVLDLAQGRPFYTPAMLGTALFKGPGAIASTTVSLETVLVFTWVHFLVFAFLGGVASYLLARAEESPNLGFGVVLLFVIFMFGFIAVTMTFAEPVLQALAWPAVLAGNVLAAAAMSVYFWRRHPQLRILP